MDISPSKSFTDLESIPPTQTAELDYRRFLKIRSKYVHYYTQDVLDLICKFHNKIIFKIAVFNLRW